MLDVARIALAIREAGLSGWLFYNQFHRDEISDLALDVPARDAQQPAVGLGPAGGRASRPASCTRSSRASSTHLPGRLVRCTSRDELVAAVVAALPPRARRRGAVLRILPRDLLPRPRHRPPARARSASAWPRPRTSSSTASARSTRTRRPRTAGPPSRCTPWCTTPGAGSVPRSPTAGPCTRRTSRSGWPVSSPTPGLVSDGPVLAAAGEASADPHYEPVGRGRRLARGDVVQLDLWAREPGERTVFADISWVGVLAPRPAGGAGAGVRGRGRGPRRGARCDRQRGSPRGSRAPRWIGRPGT